MTIPKLRGGGRQYVFPSMKNSVVLINFIILGGGLGVCSPRKNF